MRPVKLHRLGQLRLRELHRVNGPQGTRPDDANVPVDPLPMADQPRGVIARQPRLLVESPRVTVGVVIPPIGAHVVVELADLDRSLPAEVSFELALFRRLAAEVVELERHDLAGDVVEDGRVGGLRGGAEDVAVGFRGVGLTSRLARYFVGAPLTFLAPRAAVSCVLASAAFEGAGF